MDEVTRAAFANELSKIAGAMDMARKAMWAGWHGINPDMSQMAGAGWRAGAGKLTRHLPGAKALTVGTAALQAPGVLAREDPSGHGQGRLERATRMVGATAGSLLGAGLMTGTRFGQKNPFTGAIAGNILGAGAGTHLLAAPFAAKRLLFGRRNPAAPPRTPPAQANQRPADSAWRNVAPGGLATTPDAITGQAQAM